MGQGQPGRWREAWAWAVCGAVLAAYAGLAGSAVGTKSPTIDEPVHAVSGWMALRLGDYRLEVTNPPLWKLWAAAGDAAVPLPLDRTGVLWRPVAWRPVAEAPWSRRVLFDTPGTDGGRFIGRARWMMLAVAVALGAAVAGWAGRLAGPVAAVVGVGLFAFDPGFLGHGPLVKSDVAESLAMVGVGWTAWRFGRGATVGGAVGLGLACGAAMTVKFSGLLAGPIAVVLLAGRAVAPVAWPAFGRGVTTRPGRLAVAAIGCGLAAVVSLGVIWGCYRFRYRPAADPSLAIDVPAVYAAAVAADGGTVARLAGWADHRRLLPQAFTAGLLNQLANARRWPAFLDGQVYDDGRRSYYPLAVAYKTPAAELAAFAAAAVVGVAAALGRGWRRPGVAWSAACVGVPAAVLAVAAVGVPLNIGVRNVLPAYAYADVAAAAAAAWAWRRRPRITAVALVALLGGQAATAVVAWPDYIAFFNAAAGGTAGGVDHLGDSNLDWGQDLPALIAWQRNHPDVPLYADLFTLVDPTFYGLRYHKLWERDADGRAVLRLPPGPAVLAVSVTHLQGLYVDPSQVPLLSRLRRRRPRAVLHGTIALFDWPLAADGG